MKFPKHRLHAIRVGWGKYHPEEKFFAKPFKLLAFPMKL